MRFLKITFLFILLLVISCKKKLSEYQKLQIAYSKSPDKWPPPFIEDTIVWKELGILPEPNYPKGKKPSNELIELGKQLFFDARLSQSKQIACASCHHPDQNWTDNRTVSLGNRLLEGKRNAPTILNLSYNTHFFWDGRAKSLEKQLIDPITNPVEMNTSLDTVVNRVRNIKGYKQQFFSTLKVKKIKLSDIAYAIATFERSVISRKSRFDNFLEGKIKLSEKELKGLHLFRTKARCMNCHNGPLFTDHKFHNLGLTYYGRKYEDLGLYNVTKKAEDVGKFRTPSLRDVMKTGPWMHNGLFGRMDGVIAMYNNGMPQPTPSVEQENDSLFPKTSPIIKKLNLTVEETKSLQSFLEAISEPALGVSMPKFLE